MEMISASGKTVKVRLEGSYIGCTRRQRETLRGLGLNRRGRTVTVKVTEPVAGMLRKVQHLVAVEE